MIMTLNIIWAIVVTSIIVIAFYKIAKFYKKDYKEFSKYYININKRGFNISKCPLIKLKINGKFKYFLLDTGAAVNALSMEGMKQIYNDDHVFSVIGQQQLVGINGTTDKYFKIIEETVSFNKDKVKTTFVVTDALEESIKNTKELCGIEFLGILGAEFFNKARWVLDLESLVVWVKK